jgi:hypothetical protein
MEGISTWMAANNDVMWISASGEATNHNVNESNSGGVYGW